MSDRKRTVTSVELPEKMLYDLSRLAGEMHLSKSDLIRWGIERILAHPPQTWQIDPVTHSNEIQQIMEGMSNGTKEVCGADEGNTN